MAYLSENSGDQFQASSLAKWFHSALHKDFDFDDTTTIFTPSDKSYNEALFLLAIAISSFGVLVCIFMLLYSCYFTCTTKQNILTRNLYQRRRSCLQSFIFIFALICCAVITVGFIFNGKASDGVEQFCDSVNNIQHNLYNAHSMGEHTVKIPLFDATENLIILKEESGLPDATTAVDSCNDIQKYLFNINHCLPVDMLNRGSDFGGKVHRYDNYRWLVSVGLYTWAVFLCVFCFWSYCQINGCTMLLLTILSFSSILLSWAVLGAHFGIAVGVGDFCVNPATSIKKISHSNITSVIIDYYIKCSNYDPFADNFKSINKTLDLVLTLIGDIAKEYVKYLILVQKISLNLKDFRRNLSLYQSEFTCSKIHKEYMDGMDSLCNKALTGFAIIILSFLVIAFLSGLLTCCVCPLWKYRKPYHHAYPNSGNSRGDGNAVLWWPDNLDANPDENHAHGHVNFGSDPERVPFVSNQPSSNYSTMDHSNLDFIQPNTTIPHRPMNNSDHSEGTNDSQHSARHSF